MTKRVIPSRTLKNEPWASVWLNGVRSPEAEKQNDVRVSGGERRMTRQTKKESANEAGISPLNVPRQ